MLGGCSELQACPGPDSPRATGGGVPIRAPGLWEEGPPQSPQDCGEDPLKTPRTAGEGPLRAPGTVGGTPTLT